MSFCIQKLSAVFAFFGIHGDQFIAKWAVLPEIVYNFNRCFHVCGLNWKFLIPDNKFCFTVRTDEFFVHLIFRYFVLRVACRTFNFHGIPLIICQPLASKVCFFIQNTAFDYSENFSLLDLCQKIPFFNDKRQLFINSYKGVSRIWISQIRNIRNFTMQYFCKSGDFCRSGLRLPLFPLFNALFCDGCLFCKVRHCHSAQFAELFESVPVKNHSNLHVLC